MIGLKIAEVVTSATPAVPFLLHRRRDRCRGGCGADFQFLD
jgi:hypothetical protein